jgi:hypothetical protein
MQTDKFTMENWFDEMLRERPSLVEGLQSHGITSASAYMKVAETLPVEILDEIERFRFMRLLPSINREDPFQIVNIAPAWVLDLTISHLELTVRCQTVLEWENIKVVSELRNYRLETAMGWKNFGKKSAQDLSAGLMAAIKVGAPHFKLAALAISEGNGEQDERWFEQMSVEKPSLMAGLADEGIISSSTYLQKRDFLSNEVLEEVDGFRFTQMVSSINREDPFQLVRIAPFWLLRVPLTQLELTARCANVLKHKALLRVGDLLNYQFDEARHWKNFGKKSARDLSLELQKAIERGAQHFEMAAALNKLTDTRASDSQEDVHYTSAGDVLNDPFSTSLRESLRVAHEALNEREGIVFQGRLMSYPRQTLEQIGDQLGVTRERVRQLEDRYLRVLEKRYFFPMLIGLKIARLFRARSTPLYLDAIHQEDPWFDGFSDDTGKLSTLIRAFSEWSTFECDNRIIVSAIGEDEFDNLKRNALESLRRSGPMVLKESEVAAILRDLAMGAGAPELGEVLSTVLQDQLHFTSPTDASEPLLSGVGWGVRHTVIALLNEAEQPLHYSELTRRCSARLGREVEERRVHSVLITDNAQYYGRGTYGTRKHFPFGQDLKDEVRTEVENIILTGPPGRQWHATELVDLLADRRPDLPEEVDKYIVNIILESSSQLESLGRFVWVSAVRAHGTSERIELRDLCSAILTDVGRPMRTESIREEIEKIRGTGEFFIIGANEEVARVRPGVWGLVERDFFATNEQRIEILDALNSILIARNTGLHESELTDALLRFSCHVPGRLTDYMVMSLAQTDERFNLHRGGIMALAEWGDPRRLTVRQAFGQFVAQMETSYSMPNIVRYVEQKVERAVRKHEVYALLNQFDVIYESSTATYRKRSIDDVDVDTADELTDDPLEVLYRTLITTSPSQG